MPTESSRLNAIKSYTRILYIFVFILVCNFSRTIAVCVCSIVNSVSYSQIDNDLSKCNLSIIYALEEYELCAVCIVCTHTIHITSSISMLPINSTTDILDSDWSFTVGSSMQDLSREEFSLLNAGCDKDTIITGAETSLERIKLGRTPDLESTASTSAKLDDPVDVFPWHATSTNIGSNLLWVEVTKWPHLCDFHLNFFFMPILLFHSFY